MVEKDISAKIDELLKTILRNLHSIELGYRQSDTYAYSKSWEDSLQAIKDAVDRLRAIVKLVQSGKHLNPHRQSAPGSLPYVGNSVNT